MLAARIDRLDPPTKALLQTLAVVGETVGSELAREVAGEPDEDLRSRLAALEAGEFLYEERSRAGMEYVFKHALTQEAAYASLLGDRRRALHERAARAIERALRDGDSTITTARSRTTTAGAATPRRRSNTSRSRPTRRRRGRRTRRRSDISTTAIELLVDGPRVAGS